MKNVKKKIKIIYIQIKVPKLGEQRATFNEDETNNLKSQVENQNKKITEMEAIISHMKKKILELMEEIDGKDGELKVLTEKKNEQEQQDLASDQLLITKNQLLLLLTEKSNLTDKIIRESFEYLSEKTDLKLSKSGTTNRRPIPPPPPILDGDGLGTQVTLKGYLLSQYYFYFLFLFFIFIFHFLFSFFLKTNSMALFSGIYLVISIFKKFRYINFERCIYKFLFPFFRIILLVWC